MNSGGAGVPAPRSMQLTGRVMGFLIKSAFWFSLVLLALPINTGKNGEQSVGAIQAFLAAREAVSDLSGICERKPDVCETGKSAMTTVGLRAREAARIAYELLDENLEEPAASRPGACFGQDAEAGLRRCHRQHRRDHPQRRAQELTHIG